MHVHRRCVLSEAAGVFKLAPFWFMLSSGYGLNGRCGVKGGTFVSRTAKVIYFFVALLVMACFAVGSVMLAEQRPAIAVTLFVLAVLGAGAGFASKRKVMNR